MDKLTTYKTIAFIIWSLLLVVFAIGAIRVSKKSMEDLRNHNRKIGAKQKRQVTVHSRKHEHAGHA